MAHTYQNAHQHLSHTKTITSTLIALGLVLLLAVGSGVAFNLQDKKQQSALTKVDTSDGNTTKTDAVQPSGSDTTNEEKAVTMPEESSQQSGETTSPGVSNSSNTSTTVTVNGQSVHVTGNGSLDKSYSSSDGHTKVHISIDNAQNSKEDGNGN